MVRWFWWHCPPDTGFEIRALAVWGRARYLSVTEAPHDTDFHTWMGKKHFCFFQTAETGNRTPNPGVKGSGANHYPIGPRPEPASVRIPGRGIPLRHQVWHARSFLPPASSILGHAQDTQRNWTNAGLCLRQRLRRWPKHKPALVQCLVFVRWVNGAPLPCGLLSYPTQNGIDWIRYKRQEVLTVVFGEDWGASDLWVTRAKYGHTIETHIYLDRNNVPLWSS